MENKSRARIQSLNTLQFIAIIAVVIGHFWVKESSFLNSAGVAFCFVYSGYFTARNHRFPAGYGMGDHMRFMWGKIAKLYPLHALGIALGAITMATVWGGDIQPKIIIAHLTMLSSWIPFSHYFFGVNPVAWYVCDLFFLYLVSPLVVRGLKKLSVIAQIALFALLLAVEFTVEARSMLGLYHYYFIYQFPVIRLLDFATGIIIFNVTQTVTWQQIKNSLTARRATLIEMASIGAFLVLFIVGQRWLHPHCYRAYCASAPAIVALLVPFILTGGSDGMASRLLRLPAFAWLSGIGAEIYLLQFSPFFLVQHLLQSCGIVLPTSLYFLTQTATLIILSWFVNRYYTNPLKKKLMRVLDNRHKSVQK